jgi:AcrR family transcriptional regulator
MALMQERTPKKPPRKLTRKTKEQRQREIIDAAVRLIGEYGVRGTTVSRIAAAVGISRGALYQHFPNREAVLAAALDYWGERSSAWLNGSEEADIPARLAQMGEAHSQWALSEYNTFVRPFFQLIASNRQGQLTQSIVDRQQQDFRYLVELVDEGKRAGRITSDCDSGDIAWTLLLHAWGEDIARLMGVGQFITEGASERILKRALNSYST